MQWPTTDVDVWCHQVVRRLDALQHLRADASNRISTSDCQTYQTSRPLLRTSLWRMSHHPCASAKYGKNSRCVPNGIFPVDMSFASIFAPYTLSPHAQTSLDAVHDAAQDGPHTYQRHTNTRWSTTQWLATTGQTTPPGDHPRPQGRPRLPHRMQCIPISRTSRTVGRLSSCLWVQRRENHMPIHPNLRESLSVVKCSCAGPAPCAADSDFVGDPASAQAPCHPTVALRTFFMVTSARFCAWKPTPPMMPCLPAPGTDHCPLGGAKVANNAAATCTARTRASESGTSGEMVGL